MRVSTSEIVVLALVGFGGWYGWTHYQTDIKQKLGMAPPPKVRVLDAQFKCDGRIYCSQMTSCEETRFFLRYCENTKLGREWGGVDCEKQWCEGEIRQGRLHHLTQ